MSKRIPTSVSVAALITNEKGDLLLVQQAAPEKEHKWGPPAGGILAHDDPIIALQREAKEEIGLDVACIDLVGIYPVDRGDEASGIGFVFRCTIPNNKITINKDEIQDFKFFSKSELEELIRTHQLYKPEYNIPCIQDYFAGKSFPLEVIKPIQK